MTTMTNDDHIATTTRPAERRLTTKTKSATKTTEFYAYVATTVSVLLTGLLTKTDNGHDDRLATQKTWLIVNILTVNYMISHGLAKSDSRKPYTNDTNSNHR